MRASVLVRWVSSRRDETHRKGLAMLNHPVTGLTNASKWRHEELLVEADHERRAALCTGPIRQALWRALLGSLRIEQPLEDVWHAARLTLARSGR